MYKATIGIEVHAELKTKTKMFCNSQNAPHDSEPNTHVCPVCMAHPGTLPVINKEAVKHVLKVGVALGGTLASFTEFDRKNYFYPDIPKGYQISQYKFPLVSGGELAGVKITRVHLEEDTARSLHDQGEGSIIDYNRAGVPLMELVTEPTIHDAETAANFARELQLLLRTLGVSDANMEKGEMRVEANISISDTDKLGTKVEVKNLNSFKAVEGAIRYEVERQTQNMAQNKAILQETRGWNDQKSLTFSQRLKESSEDYRYFPDPDLPKLDLSKVNEFSRLSEEMPELPNKKRAKYENLGLPREQIEMIISDNSLEIFFESVASRFELGGTEIKLAANYLTSDAQALLAEDSTKSLKEASADAFVDLLRMIAVGEINSRVAKDLLSEVLFAGLDPQVLATDRGLLQKNSEEDLRVIVQDILKEHGTVVSEYRSGKEAVIKFLVGQAMKATKGSANPELLLKLFKEELSK